MSDKPEERPALFIGFVRQRISVREAKNLRQQHLHTDIIQTFDSGIRASHSDQRCSPSKQATPRRKSLMLGGSVFGHSIAPLGSTNSYGQPNGDVRHGR